LGEAQPLGWKNSQKKAGGKGKAKREWEQRGAKKKRLIENDS